MNHIKTKSQAEESMRGLYKQSDGTPIKAEDKHVLMLRKIVDMVRRRDLLDLEISKEQGALMGYMQEHGSLVDKDGLPLVTWENGADKASVDYEAIVAEMDVPQEVIQRFTTVKKGSRVFTVKDENLR